MKLAWRLWNLCAKASLSFHWRSEFSPPKSAPHQSMKFGARDAPGELGKLPRPPGAPRGFPSGRVSPSSLSRMTVRPRIHRGSCLSRPSPQVRPRPPCSASFPGPHVGLLTRDPSSCVHPGRLWLGNCFAFHSQETAEPLVADCSVPLSLSP